MGPERASALRLLETILRQLGLGTPLLLPLACSSSSPGDGDEGGVTTNPSTGQDTDPDPEGEASSSSADTDVDGEVGSDDGDELKLDVFVDPDGPPPAQCWSLWYYDPQEFPPEFTDCSFGPFDPGLVPVYMMICVAPPDDSSCADICTDGLCEGMTDCLWSTVWDSCGPVEVDGECCTMIATEEPPPVGRPFVVAGQPRLAAVSEQLPALAAHWLATARGEHASIAAFARFVATLLRFAAPARLLADALAAARDEAQHTRDALTLASRFAARPLALGALAVADALRDTNELARAVHEAIVEGCVDETLAAHEASCLAAHARDPQVIATLQRIASDEARHAALAWRFVAWVLETRPELRPTVEQAFAVALARRPSTRAHAPEQLLAFGCPSASLRARWRELGVRELVAPCAARLLATVQRTARAQPSV